MATVRLINWQKLMIKVLAAVLPLIAFAVYLFGLRVLVVLAVCNLTAFAAEFAFTRREGKPASSAAFVTATLFAMSLPPPIPLWMAAVGTAFGIIFGKMVFGGFGRNIFNPALTGRAFIYVSFGGFMTAQWQEPFTGFPGGLTRYTMDAMDALTGATPGMLMKTGADFAPLKLFLGTTSGTIGGTSALLAIAGGLYLVFSKTANYRIPLAGIIAYTATQFILWKTGSAEALDPLHSIMAGSFLAGIFFYATDPVSASQTDEGRWLYGAFIGAMSSIITAFSAWPAGTMFSVLLANMFAPICDYMIRELKAERKAGAA